MSRGSASQVMPPAVASTILPSDRMLCTQLWCPGCPRIPRFVTTQNSCSFTKNIFNVDDVTEEHEVVSVYPHTRSCFSRWRWMHGGAQPCTKPIAIMTWQFTPASRQPHMLLSKRPTLLLSVQASCGSSTNFFHEQRCKFVPSARLTTSKPQV